MLLTTTLAHFITIHLDGKQKRFNQINTLKWTCNAIYLCAKRLAKRSHRRSVYRSLRPDFIGINM